MEIKVGKRYKWPDAEPGDYLTIIELNEVEGSVKFKCDDGYTSDANIEAVEHWESLDTENTIDNVVNPAHYTSTKISALDVVNDWELDFYLGNTLKYMKRYQLKGNPIQDLEKAVQYLQLKIQLLKESSK